MQNKEKQTTHGIMFHHFHDERHPVSQGSLDAEEFSAMLDWLDERYEILSAEDYADRVLSGSLSSRDICISFDDALLCQYDVAWPELKRRNIKAFFFVYSSPMLGEPDLLEVFRYFRTAAFDSVEEFYEQFFEAAEQADPSRYRKSRDAYAGLNYLAEFPFYTPGDRWFRYLRDKVLGKAAYECLMQDMMAAANFDIVAISRLLWLDDDQLRELVADGQVIGLHSFSHPTVMHTLSEAEQRLEYSKNLEHLERVLPGYRIRTMSHPCGNYDAQTLRVLNELGIQVGFRSSMSVREIRSPLEVPREDHANIAKEMEL